MSVEIIGVEELKSVMKSVKLQLGEILVEAGKDLCLVAEQKARKSCPIDTGALNYSIHTEQMETTPHSAEFDIVAGNPGILRGMGPFKTSHKTNEPVSVQSTDQYAAAVEENEKFMEETANWLEKNAPLRILGLMKGYM